MAITQAVSAGISLVPEVFKFFSGLSQKRQAARINPENPGFVRNESLIDNARILENRYKNYTMPGYSTAVNNINASAASGFNRGVEGASSGGDVLDLATKINYNEGQALNDLSGRNAAGADAALEQYLQANAVAGNEAVRKNMFDLDQYDQKLREKATLLQAGNTNQFSALDSGANALRYFTQPQQQLTQPGANTSGFMPSGSIFTTPGEHQKNIMLQTNSSSTKGRFA